MIKLKKNNLKELIDVNMKNSINVIDIGLGNKVIKLNAKFSYDNNPHSKYYGKFNIPNELNLPVCYNNDTVEKTLFTNKLINLELSSIFWVNYDSILYGYTFYVKKIKQPSI